MTDDDNPLRARDRGIPFAGTPGAWNAITDVPGVEVGFTTLISGEGRKAVRTGVTVILPCGAAGADEAVAAAVYSLNGNGEMTGTHWIDESGSFSTPVAITNTHAVGPAHRGIIDWMTRRSPSEDERWLLPVVAETYDGFLNDGDGTQVTSEHIIEALDAAQSGPVPEGSAGGGTGMICYGFKGGSGTASRVVTHGRDRYTVGVFVQANFGSRAELTVAGVPIGPHVLDDDPFADDSVAQPPGAGSVIVIVGTDAPLLPTQCKAMARRVPLGLARTGTTGSHFSGDIFLAFSTANSGTLGSRFDADRETNRYASMSFIPWPDIDPLYAAVVQSVEEAVVNALVAGEEMVGWKGHRVPAMPIDVVTDLLRQHGRLL